jgi:hypothetical protein
MTSEGDTNSDQIADTSQAGRSRRPGWGVGAAGQWRADSRSPMAGNGQGTSEAQQ